MLSLIFVIDMKTTSPVSLSIDRLCVYNGGRKEGIFSEVSTSNAVSTGITNNSVYLF